MYRVLIVEDEDLIRKGIMFTAKWQDYNCTVVGEAIDGLDGIKKIEELKPDIIIVDINMPNIGGLEMIENTINNFSYQAIIISGYSEFDYAKRAIKLGVTEYLLKPINYEELYQGLEKIISKMEKRSEIEERVKYIKEEKVKMGLLTDFENGVDIVINKYVKIMLDQICKKYKSKISIMDISSECGMSCTYLNSKFKNETGYTFNDYLNRYRIQKAVDLLKEDQYKIYEIADKVGFADYKYFIKVFKKYIGYCPSKFIGGK